MTPRNRPIPPQDQPPDFPYGPGEIRDLESKAPNIVAFMRRLTQPGSPQHSEMMEHIRSMLRLREAIVSALSRRVPAGMVLMVVAALDSDPKFKRGVEQCLMEGDPDEALREYVKKAFSAKGIEIAYKEVEDEPE